MRCYTPTIHGDGHDMPFATMKLDAGGQYVKLTDYLELQRKCKPKPRRCWSYTETNLKWWNCWRWMFFPMAVLRCDYSSTGFLVPLKTAKSICDAYNGVIQEHAE